MCFCVYSYFLQVLKEMPAFPEDRESGPEARLRRRYVNLEYPALYIV